MIKSLVLGGAMLLLTPLVSSAAVVSFVGSLTAVQSGAPQAPLNGIVPIDLSGAFIATDGASPRPITGGAITLTSLAPGSPFSFTLAPLPASSMGVTPSVAIFAVYTGNLAGGTLREFQFSFATTTPSTVINQAKFNEFVGSTVNVTMTEFFGSGTVYSGTITATPEPGSLLAFSALAVTIGGVKLRRRAKVATATA